jgi:hypothetical protein
MVKVKADRMVVDLPGTIDILPWDSGCRWLLEPGAKA